MLKSTGRHHRPGDHDPRISFEVIGVLSEKGRRLVLQPDEQILIPRDGRYRVMGTDRLRSITVQAQT